MHRKLQIITWLLLAATAIVIVWRAVKILIIGSSSKPIQQTRHDSVRAIVHPQPSKQAPPSNLQQSDTSQSNTPGKLSTDHIGIPRQPTVDVFLVSASRDRERDLLIRYIDGLKRRYEILRLFRNDTVIVDSTFRLIPVLEHWFATAPTAPVKRYRNLFNPIESYCRTDAPVHAIIAGTMNAAAGAMIADLRCLRNRRNVSFTLALHRNLSYDVWKRALEDLAIPYYTIPNHEE